MAEAETSIFGAALTLLADPSGEIRLHRLVHGEVDRILAAAGSDEFAAGAPWSEDELRRRVPAYEGLVAELGRIAGAGGFWGHADHDDLWVAVLERLAARPDGGTGPWLELARYPALLCLYAAGVAAVARHRYSTLRALLTQPAIIESGRPKAMTDVLNPFAVLDLRFAQKLPGLERHKTPFNDRFYGVVRAWLTLPVPDDGSYERAFDEYEYLFGLVALDTSDRGWAPPGRFAWKHGGDLDPGARLAAEAKTRGGQAAFLAAGLFAGSAERFDELRTTYAAILQRSGFAW